MQKYEESPSRFNDGVSVLLYDAQPSSLGFRIRGGRKQAPTLPSRRIESWNGRQRAYHNISLSQVAVNARRRESFKYLHPHLLHQLRLSRLTSLRQSSGVFQTGQQNKCGGLPFLTTSYWRQWCSSISMGKLIASIDAFIQTDLENPSYVD